MQPEPFFLTFALYNAKEGKKISEDFHFNGNSYQIRHMLPSDITDGASHSRPAANGAAASLSTGAFDVKWLELQKQASSFDLNSSSRNIALQHALCFLRTIRMLLVCTVLCAIDGFLSPFCVSLCTVFYLQTY